MMRKNKHYSLSTKICSSFVFLSVIIFSITTISLYFILSYDIYQSSTSFLKNEIALVTNIMQQHPHDASALQQEVIWEPKINGDKFMVRILDHQGKVLIQTKNIQQIIPAHYLLAKQVIPSKPITVRSTQNKKYYRLLFEPIKNPLKSKANKPTLIMVAVDVTREYQVLSHYKNYLLAIFLLGVFVSWLLAYFISRRLVKPIDKLAYKITAMSIDNIDKKVRFNAGSKEVYILIKEFNKMLNRIHKSYEQIRHFTSDVAHELRTPINNMMLACEDYFSNHTTEKTNPDEVIELTIDECNRVAKIIEQLLFILRVDEMKLELSKTKLNINKELRKLTDYFSVLASKFNIKIEIYGDETDCIEVDKTMFLRAVSNLITNAIKYSKPGGTIYLNYVQKNNHVYLKVKDTGIGMAQKDLEFIFDRFYRTDQSRSKDTGGYGLGLSIVKSIMELHNGEVKVESRLNAGTVFTLQFNYS